MSEDAQHSDRGPIDPRGQAELLELTQDAILVRDVRTSAITYWNRGAERLYGWSRQQAHDQITHSLLQTRFPVSLAAIDRALVTEGYWEGELVHTRRDGSQVVVASRQAVQRDASGQATAILEINTDITQRKLADEELVRLTTERRARQLAEGALDRLSRLQRVTAGLSEAMTPTQVAHVIVNQGIAALEASAGRIAVVDNATGQVTVLAFAGYTHVRTVVPADEHLPTNEVLRTAQPLFLPTAAEVQAQFPILKDIAQPMLVGALAAVPLVVDNRTVGAMTLAFDHDREFAAPDRELLSALAKQCAQALERARLYELSLTTQQDLRRSRDQLAAILSGIAEGVTVQDLEGRLIYANEIAARLSGFASVDDFKQATPSAVARFTLWDEAGNPFPLDQLPGRRLLRGEQPREVVIQFRQSDNGEERWSLLDARPVYDDLGQLQLVVNIFREITERKHRTDAADFLAAASTILGATLDATASLQQVADLAVTRIADWCIVDLVDGPRGQSTRVAVAHADPDDRDLAQTLRRAPPADDAQRRLFIERLQPRSCIVVPLVARGQTFGSITLATVTSGRRFAHFDHQLATDLATRAALAIDNARLYHEAQEQVEHQGVLNVALRETVDERDRAVVDLQHALRTRDEFLASASHDLKNPLASIKATAQLMQRRLNRSGPADVVALREGLHRIDSIATRATGLVEELLDLARMQMGRPLDLDRQSADLVRLVREVADEHQNATEQHSLHLEAEEPELLGTWDTRRLGRVFSNLLDNAVKYSPDGGPIVVRVRRDGDRAVIQVIDQGIGIPRAEQGRIFERFQRASNAERRVVGTGIGLASARHILDGHGGTIEVASEEGSGATFTVRLPIDGGG